MVALHAEHEVEDFVAAGNDAQEDGDGLVLAQLIEVDVMGFEQEAAEAAALVIAGAEADGVVESPNGILKKVGVPLDVHVTHAVDKLIFHDS